MLKINPYPESSNRRRPLAYFTILSKNFQLQWVRRDHRLKMERSTLTGDNVIYRLVHKRMMLTTDSLVTFADALNDRNFRGETPLIIAAQKQSMPVMRSILAIMSEVDWQDINGNTALHHAVHRQDRSFIIPLLAAEKQNPLGDIAAFLDDYDA